jgi:hypothetical protein
MGIAPSVQLCQRSPAGFQGALQALWIGAVAARIVSRAGYAGRAGSFKGIRSASSAEGWSAVKTTTGFLRRVNVMLPAATLPCGVNPPQVTANLYSLFITHLP